MQKLLELADELPNPFGMISKCNHVGSFGQFQIWKTIVAETLPFIRRLELCIVLHGSPITSCFKCTCNQKFYFSFDEDPIVCVYEDLFTKSRYKFLLSILGLIDRFHSRMDDLVIDLFNLVSAADLLDMYSSVFKSRTSITPLLKRIFELLHPNLIDSFKGLVEWNYYVFGETYINEFDIKLYSICKCSKDFTTESFHEIVVQSMMDLLINQYLPHKKLALTITHMATDMKLDDLVLMIPVCLQIINSPDGTRSPDIKNTEKIRNRAYTASMFIGYMSNAFPEFKELVDNDPCPKKRYSELFWDEDTAYEYINSVEIDASNCRAGQQMYHVYLNLNSQMGAFYFSKIADKDRIYQAFAAKLVSLDIVNDFLQVHSKSTSILHHSISDLLNFANVDAQLD